MIFSFYVGVSVGEQDVTNVPGIKVYVIKFNIFAVFPDGDERIYGFI